MKCTLARFPTHVNASSLSEIVKIKNIRISTEVQHGMGPLINMQKSVFLLLWDNYELYGRKILYIESFFGHRI